MNKLKKTVTTKINKEFAKSIDNYKKTMSLLIADLPLQSLCLDKPTEKILLNNGFLRVFELINLDFTKIKGIGKLRCQRLASSLNQFISIGS